MDTMVSLGLIINELVSNALKYAFSDNNEGILSISLKKIKTDSYELSIRDTGSGLPEDLDLQNAKSLGLLIVNSLVDQIHGTLEMRSIDGAEFKIIFSTKLPN